MTPKGTAALCIDVILTIVAKFTMQYFTETAIFNAPRASRDDEYELTKLENFTSLSTAGWKIAFWLKLILRARNKTERSCNEVVSGGEFTTAGGGCAPAPFVYVYCSSVFRSYVIDNVNSRVYCRRDSFARLAPGISFSFCSLRLGQYFFSRKEFSCFRQYCASFKEAESSGIKSLSDWVSTLMIEFRAVRNRRGHSPTALSNGPLDGSNYCLMDLKAFHCNSIWNAEWGRVDESDT